MPRDHRRAKEMSNYTDKDYCILHDHMTAIGRERDYLRSEVERLMQQIKTMRDEINDWLLK